MSLKKLEYFIKPTSATTIEQAVATVVTALNSTQEAVTNKITETTYKDDYFAGLFDSRSGESYLVFSDVAKTKNGLTSSSLNTTTKVDTSSFATKTYVDDAVKNVSVDLSGYVTDSEMSDAINSATVDTSSFATKMYVDNAVANATASGTDTYVIG